jgi:cytochrome b involved in lipid metabolism
MNGRIYDVTPFLNQHPVGVAFWLTIEILVY